MRRLAALALSLALLLGVGGCTPLTPGTVRVTAMLDNTAGLFVGNMVGVLGVPVGEITSITPEGQAVAVVFELDEATVPASAGAVVVARSVATDRYLELTPVHAPGPRMGDGDVIPLERTRVPAEFDEVLKVLRDLASGLRGPDGDAAGLKALLRNGADALDGRGAQVNDTVEQLAAAMSALSGQRGDITGTITELDRLSALVVANQGAIDEFITSVTDATDLFADESDSFARALDSLSRALRTLATFVRRHRDALRGSVTDLTATVERLLQRQQELEETVEVLPTTLRNIGNAVDGGRLRTRLPIRDASPVPEITDAICGVADLDELCDLLGTDPDLDELFDLLTGGGRR